MAVTLWPPATLFMLSALPSMYLTRTTSVAMSVLFAVTMIGPFWAMPTHALTDDRRFIGSMIPHRAAAILMRFESSLFA